MELKVQFVETNEEITVSFDGKQEVLVVDDTSIGKYPWSSKNTVDKLCPAFEDEGAVVQCEPIEGYPLKVVTELPEMVDSITLTQCGKNLFDYTKYPFVNRIIYASSGIDNSSSGYSSFMEYMPIGHLKGQTITLNHPGNEKALGSAGLCFYDANKTFIKGSGVYTHVVPDNAEYMRFSVPRECVDGTWATAEDIQIEIGDSVTESEEYRESVYTAEPTGQLHEWSGVKAMAGINTFWSSTGTTTVEGKSDPVAFIEKLTNAVLSLGGNI